MKTDLQAANKLLVGALQQHRFDNAVGFIHSYDIHKTNKVIAGLLARIDGLEYERKDIGDDSGMLCGVYGDAEMMECTSEKQLTGIAIDRHLENES